MCIKGGKHLKNLSCDNWQRECIIFKVCLLCHIMAKAKRVDIFHWQLVFMCGKSCSNFWITHWHILQVKQLFPAVSSINDSRNKISDTHMHVINGVTLLQPHIDFNFNTNAWTEDKNWSLTDSTSVKHQWTSGRRLTSGVIPPQRDETFQGVQGLL